MTWLVLGGAALVGLVYLFNLFMRGEIRALVRALRWTTGGLLLGGAGWGLLRGNLLIASMLAAAGVGVLMRGRLGPLDFGAGMSSAGAHSEVRSRYFDMVLDHDSGSVAGTVIAGHFKGKPLADLDAAECWALFDEVDDDPDSKALLVTWLNANREGWREHFASEFGMRGEQQEQPEDPLAEAYAVLGLAPGADEAAIKAAHRRLMKSMHPDAGGSPLLAAKINEAKDILLRQARGRTKS